MTQNGLPVAGGRRRSPGHRELEPGLASLRRIAALGRNRRDLCRECKDVDKQEAGKFGEPSSLVSGPVLFMDSQVAFRSDGVSEADHRRRNLVFSVEPPNACLQSVAALRHKLPYRSLQRLTKLEGRRCIQTCIQGLQSVHISAGHILWHACRNVKGWRVRVGSFDRNLQDATLLKTTSVLPAKGVASEVHLEILDQASTLIWIATDDEHHESMANPTMCGGNRPPIRVVENGTRRCERGGPSPTLGMRAVALEHRHREKVALWCGDQNSPVDARA